jgi:amino acid transporter
MSTTVQELKRFMVGRPLPTDAEHHQRLSKTLALAVFSSDALSSVAYATEEILLVLAAAGTAAALQWSLPIAAAIVGLLLIVTTSYWQTIEAYPAGGGSYIVAMENLGTVAGQTAGAALMIDYVLTVSVSVAAGVAAITSAAPALLPYRVDLGLAAIAALTLANLRGVRESGRTFAVPTYGFVLCFASVVLWGLIHLFRAGMPAAALEPAAPAVTSVAAAITPFLFLHAFASGCTALTGVEAISNGVAAFQRPESRNARLTLLTMALILGGLFAGITVLAHAYGVMPRENETVVSQVARLSFGSGPPYYVVQAFTALILIVAANTSFADFPRLCSLHARDRFLPRQLTHRGDRLVFSNGIVLLGMVAAALLVLFGGDTHALIPLYAVGVFLAFTLSQAGMVVHWWRRRHPGWRRHMVVNGTGAVTTAIVTVIIAATKFTHGAWIVVLLIPALVVVFFRIHAHYDRVASQLSLTTYRPGAHPQNFVLVLVGGVHQASLQAVEYARTLGPHVTAVYVDQDGDEASVLEKWRQWGGDTPLVVLPSPYRELMPTLLAYIDRYHAVVKEDGYITLVLPEFVPRRWWHVLLHNQTALRLKAALMFKSGIAVVDVPYHLGA